MISNHYRFAVRVRHEPTGVKATVTAHLYRSTRQAIEAATRVVNVRVLAARYAEIYGMPEAFEYDLPDDAPYPNELLEYRRHNVIAQGREHSERPAGAEG